jgi:hypothetical protein
MTSPASSGLTDRYAPPSMPAWRLQSHAWTPSVEEFHSDLFHDRHHSAKSNAQSALGQIRYFGTIIRVMDGDAIRALEERRLRSHELHIKYIYGIRLGGLALSALTIIIGAVMVFLGLQGSFNWAVEAPNSIGAKLTNASPGIVFATVGLIIAFVVVMQKPVNYDTEEDGQSITLGGDRPRPKRRIRGMSAGGD